VDERELELRKAGDRLEVLDGMLRAIDERVEVDNVIWNASDANEAHLLLTSEPFSFSSTQAFHILDTPLRRRTIADRARLAEEAAELRAVIDD
jgi:DNA gyrase/topoisomerase IV subunit A